MSCFISVREWGEREGGREKWVGRRSKREGEVEWRGRRLDRQTHRVMFQVKESKKCKNSKTYNLAKIHVQYFTCFKDSILLLCQNIT